MNEIITPVLAKLVRRTDVDADEIEVAAVRDRMETWSRLVFDALTSGTRGGRNSRSAPDR